MMEAQEAYDLAVRHFVSFGGQRFNDQARQLSANAILAIRRQYGRNAAKWRRTALFTISGYPTKAGRLAQ